MKTTCPFLETEGQNFWSLFYAGYLVLQYCVLSSCCLGIYFHNIQVTIILKFFFLVVIDCPSETLLFKQGG